jgi:16S rRNA (uracil1498-N3)-methyltransferase
MQIFYTTNISGNNALFSREESRHCIRVLRMSKGDTIYFTDGKDNLYEGIITGDDHDAMRASITGTKPAAGKRSYRLHMAVSPLKNEVRLEWFIEKAVEIGIDEITPLVCARTEKKRFRRERLEGLILSAMKQSVKTLLPQLNEPVLFKDFVGIIPGKKKLIACCNEAYDRQAIIDTIKGEKDIIILVGPEGDFTTEEINLAVRAGYLTVHLGTSRLRTETAGIAACCSVYLANI